MPVLTSELYFDVLSGNQVAPEDIRYRFAFQEKAKATWPWVRFKDIVSVHNKLDMRIAEEIESLARHPYRMRIGINCT